MTHPLQGAGQGQALGLLDDKWFDVGSASAGGGTAAAWWLADDGSGSGQGSGSAGQSGGTGNDESGALRYYIGLGKPLAIGLGANDPGSAAPPRLAPSAAAPGLFVPSDIHGLGGLGSRGGGGGSTSATYSNGSLTFSVTYDSSVKNAPTGFLNGVQTAIGYFLNTFDSKITIKLDVGWGEVGGIALASNALGESLTSFASVSYSGLYGQMQKAAAGGSADQQTAFASLSSSSPISGAKYFIPAAEAKALGFRLIGFGADGDVGFSALSGTGYSWNFDPTQPTGASQFDFVGVAEHEISEVMGRVALLGATLGTTANTYSALDLFRYASFDATSGGTRSTQPGGTAYLSFDGGATNLSNFNTDPGQGDVGDWAGTTQANDAYNYAAAPGALALSSADTRAMNVLGYSRV